ncbi:MAG: TIGR04190 family B12-binding domain/radical SAM domain protein [Anaerolineales bacterium]|nr:TIGR04190 family B12-binding domain/radical SAM domain protein [Anaerolineales bacterium]
MSLIDLSQYTRRDVLFLHPPSVYDFRRNSASFGPVNDVIPSSPVFEMYPIGITSIADQLERAGYHVQVVNVAYRMLRDPHYDAEAMIAGSNPRLWAIDLHWLPHSHGALALAQRIKALHPGAPVLMGGLSASYHHEELARRPEVDFILRGDSTEGPVLELLRRLRTGETLSGVPNLTWTSQSGQIVVNPLTHVPSTLDELDLPAYRYVMRSVFKYWNLNNIIPYLRWLEYPMTALLTARGCTQRCAVCGGSRDAYNQICNRSEPAFRSPRRLIQDIRFIRRFSRAPIFVIHDIRMGGNAFANDLLSRLEAEQVDNEMVFELFFPGGDGFFSRLHRAVPRYSLELTLESHDPRLRSLNGKFPYSNAKVEATIESALANGCRRLDLFFMVGIPHQTRRSVLDSMDYAGKLMERFGGDGRLQVYVTPLAPFLDPGSRAYEDPQAFGYRLRAQTLEEHRRRLMRLNWGDILNYESLTLGPEDLVETTYDAVARLTRLKAEHGIITASQADRTLGRIEQARRSLKRSGEAEKSADPEQHRQWRAIQREARALSEDRMYEQTEFVSWGGGRFLFRPWGLFRLMIELLFEEVSHAWLRLRRRIYRWKAYPLGSESRP